MDSALDRLDSGLCAGFKRLIRLIAVGTRTAGTEGSAAAALDLVLRGRSLRGRRLDCTRGAAAVVVTAEASATAEEGLVPSSLDDNVPYRDVWPGACA